MMWLTKNEDGTPTGKGFSKPYCYHIDQFESLRPVFMQVFKYARAMGFDMIQGCLLYTSPSPRDGLLSRMPSSA